MDQKMSAVINDINSNLIDREREVEAAFLALLTGEHAVFLGPPGTAKSLLVREITDRIEGARYFERLLTRFSTPEELFGPLSLSALEQDRYARVLKGSILDCHFAFVDECFKANSAILNSLLTIMNERLYHEAGAAIPAPLVTLFGASNETPEDESLGALYDRFLVRVMVPYLVDEGSIRDLFTFEPQGPSETMTLDDIARAQGEVKGVKMTPATIDALVEIKKTAEAEGILASDRRWRASTKLVKAAAYMDGDTQTCADHCEVLNHSLWADPEQIRVVERVIAKVVNPLNLEAVELEDAARDLYEQKPEPDAPNLSQAVEPLLRQLSDIHTRLEQRIGSAPERKARRAKQALSKVEGWHDELRGLALASLASLHIAPGA